MATAQHVCIHSLQAVADSKGRGGGLWGRRAGGGGGGFGASPSPYRKKDSRRSSRKPSSSSSSSSSYDGPYGGRVQVRTVARVWMCVTVV